MCCIWVSVIISAGETENESARYEAIPGIIGEAGGRGGKEGEAMGMEAQGLLGKGERMITVFTLNRLSERGSKDNQSQECGEREKKGRTSTINNLYCLTLFWGYKNSETCV